MGTIGRSIVKDADQVLNHLNKALSDEWLAYYQYWIGAKVVAGPMKDAVIAELNQHAADELRHAGMIAVRIIQLKGIPVLSPKSWFEQHNCDYDAPKDPQVMSILQQNVKGEQCAIGAYNNLLMFTRDRDPVTYNIILQILQDEVEHEEDLQALVEDIELMVSK